ncbi:MAG: Gfo/Idh/MocA family protein, partial [Bacteroidota bacterium]
MNNSKLIAALASYGMSGQVFHAPFLEKHPGFQLKFILERSKNLSKERYPDAVIVRHFDDIINNKDVDLVVINTPDDLHFQMAQDALKAGKHVVVEKPFTRSLSEAQELVDLAEKNNLILAVYQNRRWDSDFLTVQKVIENGWLGKLVEFESHFDRYRLALKDDWKDQGKAGTGSIYNLGAHLIDQALVLFGKPQALWADIRRSRPGAAIDDDYEVKMIYPDVRVTLKSSYLVREKGPRFILHGTKGSVVKYGLDVQEDLLKRGE